METFLFNPQEFKRLYGCSMIPHAEWCQLGTIKTRSGLFTIGFGLFLLAFYMPVLLIMTKQKYLQHSCYRIMLFLGVQEVMFLTVITLNQGYFLIQGCMFCCLPTLTYISGAALSALWSSSEVTCALLALNRIVDIAGYDKIGRLFKDQRIFLWFLMPAASFGYFFMFNPPILSNSRLGGSYSPYAGLNDTRIPKIPYSEYANKTLMIHDFTVTALISVLYVVLIGVTFWKLKARDDRTFRVAKIVIVLQSCLIIGLVYTANIVFFTIPQHLSGIIVYLCQGASGFGGIIYICCNRELRSDFIGLGKRKKHSAVTCVVRQQSSA